MGRKKLGRQVLIKVWMNEILFAEAARNAERAGFRRGGTVLFTQKKNGLQDEKVANTNGVSKYLKHCMSYYEKAEPERLSRAAQIAEEERRLAAEKKKLGIS